MGDPRHDLGIAAERAVADWLMRSGWSVVRRRVRSSHGGEVDVIAVDPAGVLVAIEVRARRHDRAGAAIASVDRLRIGRLRRTLAIVALEERAHAGLRIDLVTAVPVPGEPNHWRLRRVAAIDA